jgi:hypothetical protein
MAKAKKKSSTLASKTVKRKIGGVRKSIIDRLAQLGKSRNWLAVTCGLRVATVYQFLAGNQDMMTGKLEQMFKVLGLEIRPKE